MPVRVRISIKNDNALVSSSYHTNVTVIAFRQCRSAAEKTAFVSIWTPPVRIRQYRGFVIPLDIRQSPRSPQCLEYSGIGLG